MLAATATEGRKLPWPMLATPKIDGFRFLKIGGRAITRSLKPVPNLHVRAWIEANLPDGVDGELIVPGASFSETASAIGSASGTPEFRCCVFDFVSGPLTQPYAARVEAMKAVLAPFVGPKVELVLPTVISGPGALKRYEAECLSAGYEGVMLRTPRSPYKCGRATEREAYLVKVKRFQDAEAVVLDTYEGTTNTNEAFTNELGMTARSTAQSGQVGRGELGGFVLRTADGVTFRCGYNHVAGGESAASIWARRAELSGKVIRFKHQPSGADKAPRFPVFLGFRAAWDMPEKN